MRIPPVFRMCLLLVLGWFVMTLTHELGHVLFGWLGGATLVELELLGLPYSFYDPNPWPTLMLWGGPVVGVVVPVLGAEVVRLVFGTGSVASRTAWFVADFCVLANGAYLALAWWSGNATLDTARLLEAGVHPAWIVAYCALTIGVGYVCFRRDVGWVLRTDAEPSDTRDAENES
ncbi:MAG: hypothetical protein AAGF84_09460 [Planctomycetota bacterium]